MFKKILVPTDGSKNAQKAVGVAVEFVKKYGDADTRVTVVHVITGPEVWATVEARQDLHERVTEKFAKEALDAFEKAGIEVEAANMSGDPGTQIVNYAGKEDFDLIIMGARGATGFSAWVPGSVANKVVSRAPCPVLLVHEDY